MSGRNRRRALAGCYVGAIGVLAVTGAVRQEAVCYLAAAACSLPLGVAALAGCYGGYALPAGIGGLFASTTAPDGSEAGWLTASSGTLNALLLIGAAVGNVLILQRRGRQRPVQPSEWAPPRRRQSSGRHPQAASPGSVRP